MGKAAIRPKFQFNPSPAVIKGFDPQLKDALNLDRLKTFDLSFNEPPSLMLTVSKLKAILPLSITKLNPQLF